MKMMHTNGIAYRWKTNFINEKKNDVRLFNNNICTPKNNRVEHIQVPWFLTTDAVTKIVYFFLNFIAFSPRIFLPNIRLNLRS